MTIEQIKIQRNIEALSHRWPKISSIIFYTPRRFEGNLKYAFIEICARIKKYNFPVTTHFLTLYAEDYFALRSEGLPAIYWSSETKKPLKALLEASVVVEDGFYCDSPPTPPLLFSALQGAKQVNLWHGTPIKKIHLQLTDSFFELDCHMSTIFKYSASIHTVCLASKNHSDLFNKAFLSKNHEVTGYPRNDILKRQITSADRINVDLETLKQVEAVDGKRIFMYAPTWRDGNPKWISKKNIEQLADIVSILNGVLIVTPHPFERDIAGRMLQEIPGIFFQRGHDIYPFLRITDILITDYSSIIFDFLLTDKVVVLYRPEHDQYIEKSRELIPEQFSSVKLPLAETLEELQDVLLKIPNAPGEEQLKLKTLHNDFNDANSSERVGNVVLNLAGCGILKRFVCCLKNALNNITKFSPTISHEKLSVHEWDFSNAEAVERLNLEGFSHWEEWGCWTDGSEAVIHFPEKLPGRMLVKLDALAYGPNRNTPIRFWTLTGEIDVLIKGGIYIFELNNLRRGEEIRIIIPTPTSPAELAESDDTRALGIGIRKISILDISVPLTKRLETAGEHTGIV
jgi:CDP-glycerol glycerophosphotransferase